MCTALPRSKVFSSSVRQYKSGCFPAGRQKKLFEPRSCVWKEIRDLMRFIHCNIPHELGERLDWIEDKIASAFVPKTRPEKYLDEGIPRVTKMKECWNMDSKPPFPSTYHFGLAAVCHSEILRVVFEPVSRSA